MHSINYIVGIVEMIKNNDDIIKTESFKFSLYFWEGL